MNLKCIYSYICCFFISVACPCQSGPALIQDFKNGVPPDNPRSSYFIHKTSCHYIPELFGTPIQKSRSTESLSHKMIGINFKMTTLLTMILMVIVISLLLPQADATLGKEAQDEYHKGYHYNPLHNKQPYPYQEHHTRSPYFPRPRHGYSRPHPKPRDTPCSCEKTFLCQWQSSYLFRNIGFLHL